ncbi:hypothetical protein F183_A03640 [Bryobacterales bacterium F-183]|nr:hypothetical protein F183_A03640 [Bryobacterales bacterium F-183]
MRISSLVWLSSAVSLCATAQIVVYHETATVERGTTRQFTAYVPLSPNAVTWMVNGVVGGAASTGTVTQTGLYRAPATVPASNVVNVQARSNAYPSIIGAARVTIVQPKPNLWSVSPNAPASGAPVTLSLSGGSLLSTAVATVNNVPWTTEFVSSTRLRMTGTFPTAGAYVVRITHPGNGANVSDPVTVNAGAAAPIVVSVTPTAATVTLGTTRAFTSNVPVTWSATAGTISAAGLYTAPAAMPASPTVVVRATSTADTTKFAQATVTLQAGSTTPPPSDPPGPVSPAYTAAARLLDQAAFGPTPAMIAELQQKGVNTWLDEQFAMAETAIPIPDSNGTVSAQTLNRLATAPDQLRQRVAWALGQFLVISANKNPYPNEYVPHLQTLSRNAFGNYRTLLREITLSPQMGKYLDLANSTKAGPNENYPRELLQLFSIGTVLLNPDGTPTGTPAYTQADVVQFARALTGWTYPTAAGSQPGATNWENFSAPAMEPRQGNHDTSAKTLLNGTVLPAGQTVEQDLDGVIDNVFQHPNVGPFVALRLIRNMVKSNPTPGYVQRVAAVFANNGAGIRGDLKAVVRAILTDAEARNDQAGPNDGRLKDPIYFYVSFVRTLGGTIRSNTQMAWVFTNMGQPVSAPQSVFGYYSPLYRLPGNPALFGPEFQIYTPTESVLLGNEMHQVIHNASSDPSIDLTPFTAAAGNVDSLLDVVNQRMFYGRMTAELRAVLRKAVLPSYDNQQRVRTALYLAALSGYYGVQY